MAHDFTPAEQALHDGLCRQFGVLRCGIRPNETAKTWFQRVQDAGLLKLVERAALRDVRTYRAITAAQDAGTVVEVTEPEQPEGLTFKKSELRTLDGYKTAVKAGEVAGKPVRYE